MFDKLDECLYSVVICKIVILQIFNFLTKVFN